MWSLVFLPLRGAPGPFTPSTPVPWPPSRPSAAGAASASVGAGPGDAMAAPLGAGGWGEAAVEHFQRGGRLAHRDGAGVRWWHAANSRRRAREAASSECRGGWRRWRMARRRGEEGRCLGLLSPQGGHHGGTLLPHEGSSGRRWALLAGNSDRTRGDGTVVCGQQTSVCKHQKIKTTPWSWLWFGHLPIQQQPKCWGTSACGSFVRDIRQILPFF